MVGPAPVNIKDVNVDLIDIRPAKTLNTKTGLKFNVFYDDKRFRLTLPEMIAPFGGGESRNYPGSYSIGVSFEGMHGSDARAQRLRRAHDKMWAINNKIRELMFQKKDIIFPKDANKNIDPVLYGARFSDFIHTYDNGRADMMYIKLQTKFINDEDRSRMTADQLEQASKEFQHIRGADETLMVDNDGKPVQVTKDNVAQVIPFGSKVKIIVDFAYIKAKPDKMNLALTVGAIRRISTGDMEKYDIPLDSDEENDDMDATNDNQKENVPNGAVGNENGVPASDDEEEEEEEDVEMRDQ